MRRRIAITGIGVLAPNAIGKTAFWEALAEGRSGIRPITGFDANSYPTRIAGQIQDFEPKDYISPRDIRRTARATWLGIAAAQLAVNDSQQKTDERDRVGVVMGVSASAMDITESQHTLFMERGLSRVSPFGVTAILPGATANNISILLGCKGTVMTISNSCPAGLDVIGFAYRTICNGSDDVFIAGGTDAQITPFGLALLCASRIMSERNDSPEAASRPFDIARDGGVPAEGAAVLVIEEVQHALARGAHIYAEILGYANRADGVGNHEAGVSDSGIERSMHLALQDGNVEPNEVDYICAHAPSDEFDRTESLAIKAVFGEHAYKIPVSSIKSMIGNPLAAAGPLQVIASVMVLEKGIVPPTINHEKPAPDCDLDYVPNQSRRSKDIKTALINCHGFGGVNSSLIIRACP